MSNSIGENGSGIGLVILEMVDAEIHYFCEMWELTEEHRPKISLGDDNSFTPCTNTITLSPDIAGHCARELTTESRLGERLSILAARTSLYHEMAHSVQLKFKGKDWIFKNRLLSEVHADIIAGYWLSDKLDSIVLENLTTLSRTKLEAPESSEYLSLCERIYTILEGIEIGKRTLDRYQSLRLSHCSRDQVLMDSLQSAERQVVSNIKPCNRVQPKLDWIAFPYCESCPNVEYRSETGQVVVGPSFRRSAVGGGDQ